MIKLYHSPRSRSMRIYWLLEELGLPYELERVELTPPTRPFSQRTPYGKLPAIQDGDVEMFESGAILEYILERYAQGRLAPPPGTPARAKFLQWIHFAESTAFIGIGNTAWHLFFKQDAESIPGPMADYRMWAEAAFDLLERELTGKDYLLGSEFSAADVMLGYSLAVAKWMGFLTERYANVLAYLGRLEARPAFQTAGD